MVECYGVFFDFGRRGLDLVENEGGSVVGFY